MRRNVTCPSIIRGDGMKRNVTCPSIINGDEEAGGEM